MSKYHLAEFLYSQDQALIEKMLAWAYSVAAAIPDPTPLEENTKDLITTAIHQLERKDTQ